MPLLEILLNWLLSLILISNRIPILIVVLLLVLLMKWVLLILLLLLLWVVEAVARIVVVVSSIHLLTHPWVLGGLGLLGHLLLDHLIINLKRILIILRTHSLSNFLRSLLTYHLVALLLLRRVDLLPLHHIIVIL